MTHASVFSGIGGPEIAAAMLGWDNLFHCEINPFGRAVLNYWFPKSVSYEDITKTDFSEWRGRVNVLTGGFPCQPFSYAGKRGGAEDDRYLWPYMFRCIDQVRPDWVVCENVAGILTMVEQGEVSEMASQRTLFDEGDGVRRYRLVETFTLQRICDDLEGHGYSVQPVLIPACAVGAPHRRDRVFIVGRRVTPDTQDDRTRRDARGVQGKENEKRIQERYYLRESDDANKVRSESIDNAINSQRIGWIERQPDYGLFNAAQQGKCGKEQPRGANSSFDRWGDFPSVSPVHRGNDGLPFNVDDLTLPFNKWRTESLKAYGNAIVPQVMYEIFKAIERVTMTQQTATNL